MFSIVADKGMGGEWLCEVHSETAQPFSTPRADFETVCPHRFHDTPALSPPNPPFRGGEVAKTTLGEVDFCRRES